MADLQDSVGASPRLGLRRREGEVRLDAEAVKDTILVEAHTKRVSIPSELAWEAGGGGLLATRAGRVKERRTAALETLVGACAGLDEGAWEAMVEHSGRHLSPRSRDRVGEQDGRRVFLVRWPVTGILDRAERGCV